MTFSGMLIDKDIANALKRSDFLKHLVIKTCEKKFLNNMFRLSFENES